MSWPPLGDPPPVPYRMFVILARDGDSWRAREVKAANHDEAVAKYSALFSSYEVMGVALLGGSGHPIRWLKQP